MSAMLCSRPFHLDVEKIYIDLGSMPRSLKIPWCVNDATAASCSIHIPAQNAHSESLRPITFHSLASTRMQARGFRNFVNLWIDSCTGFGVFLMHKAFLKTSYSQIKSQYSSSLSGQHYCASRCSSWPFPGTHAPAAMIDPGAQQLLVAPVLKCWLLKQHSNPKSQFQFCWWFVILMFFWGWVRPLKSGLGAFDGATIRNGVRCLSKNKFKLENHCGSDVVPPPPRLHFQAFHGAL